MGCSPVNRLQPIEKKFLCSPSFSRPFKAIKVLGPSYVLDWIFKLFTNPLTFESKCQPHDERDKGERKHCCLRDFPRTSPNLTPSAQADRRTRSGFHLQTCFRPDFRLEPVDPTLGMPTIRSML